MRSSLVVQERSKPLTEGKTRTKMCGFEREDKRYDDKNNLITITIIDSKC